MKCNRINTLLFNSPETWTAEDQEHFKQCASCQQIWHRYQQYKKTADRTIEPSNSNQLWQDIVKQVTDTSANQEVDPSLTYRRKFNPGWVAVAAIFGVLVGLVILIQFSLNTSLNPLTPTNPLLTMASLAGTVQIDTQLTETDQLNLYIEDIMAFSSNPVVSTDSSDWVSEMGNTTDELFSFYESIPLTEEE